MIFLFIILLFILAIIGLIILVSYRTYDTLNKIKKFRNLKAIEQDKLKNKIKVENKDLQEKINEIKSKINILEQDSTKNHESTSKLKKELQNIEKQYEKLNTEKVSQEDFHDVEKKLGSLENELSNQLNALKNKVSVVEESYGNKKYLDTKTFSEFVESEVNPLDKSVHELNKLINSNMIKVSDYVFNYDKNTQMLKIRGDSNNITNDGIDVNNMNVTNNLNLKDNGSIFFDNNFNNPYEMHVLDEDITLNIPNKSSFHINDDSQTGNTQHSFTFDGIASHKEVKAPKISIGKYSIVEQNGELTVIQNNSNSPNNEYRLT